MVASFTVDGGLACLDTLTLYKQVPVGMSSEF